MSELTLTLLRLGYLALLWVLVLAVVGVLRRDLFGTQVTRRATPRQPGRARPTRRPGSSATGAGPGGSGPGAGGSGAGAGSAAGSGAAGTAGAAARTLVVTEGSLKGTTIALGAAGVLIGRAPECTLVLDDDFASGRHARLSLDRGAWILEDLGSTNGTFLGRNKVHTPIAIEPGTPVRIGRTVLELRR